MSEFDIKGEVNIQTVPVSIATVSLGVDGAPDRVVDSRPTGVHVQELLYWFSVNGKSGVAR